MRVFKSTDKLYEVITKEEVARWKGNVIFDAGTATGKTRFILTTLSDYCKEHNKTILFICNRIALAEEVKIAINTARIRNIEVTTYQSIENALKQGHEITLNYDYLALDEFHHCLETYNLYTDLSYEYLLEHPAQKLFMSATCKGIFNMLVQEGYVDESHYYQIPKSYDYVNRFVFYYRKTAHLDIIKDKMTNTDEKIIYFTQSIKDALEVYKLYKDDATFYCSRHTKNQEAKRVLDENKGRLNNNQFEGRLLVATKALDVGITLLDKSIKTIICNMYNHSSMIQCLGRKRLVDEVDRCKFYIRNYTKGELNLYRSKHYEAMNLFKRNRSKFDSIHTSNREFANNYIYYDIKSRDLKLNKLAYLTALANESELDYMTKSKWTNQYDEEIKGIGYKNFILLKLGIDWEDLRVTDYEIYEQSKQQEDLITYLDSIIGNRLFKDGQNKLKAEFKRDGLKARTLGINTLNGNLIDRNLPYIIKSEIDNSRNTLDEQGNNIKNPNYKKSYWTVGKISY